ncbi:hypothetical protein CSOJ01_14090, partial [Colletotrichum sojae]
VWDLAPNSLDNAGVVDTDVYRPALGGQQGSPELSLAYAPERTLGAITIDKLLKLVSTPWNLVLPRLLMGAPGPWIVGFVCFSVPLAVVFPPGAMTLEFREGVMPVLLPGVPTVNINDWGNGELADIHRFALWSPFINTDVFPNVGKQKHAAVPRLTLTIPQAVLPKLLNVATIVLAAGKPVNLPNPCRASCAYNLRIDGPKLRCKSAILSKDDSRSDCVRAVFSAIDEAEDPSPIIRKNSFKLSWAPVENGVCLFNSTGRLTPSDRQP